MIYFVWDGLKPKNVSLKLPSENKLPDLKSPHHIKLEVSQSQVV